MILVVYPNRAFFYELILPLYNYLKSICECKLVPSNQLDHKTEQLCVGIFNGINHLPKNYIPWILEPPTSWRVVKDKSYVNHMKNSKRMLCLYEKHLDFYKKFNKNTIFFPYTWDKLIENTYKVKLPIKQDIDVLFYGCIDNKSIRRNKLLKKIKDNGINLFIAPICYGKKRDTLIHRSKIVFLVNYYENNCDICRITYLVSNKKFVLIDDWCLVESVKKLYGNKLKFTNENNMIEKINYYLKNEKDRCKIIEDSYDYIKKNVIAENYISDNKLFSS